MQVWNKGLMMALVAAFVVGTVGCGQQEVVFPCDDGSGDDDDDSNNNGDYPDGPYAIQKDKTFPQLTWAGRLDGDDAEFKSKEDAYEQREDKKALVVVISAKN